MEYYNIYLGSSRISNVNPVLSKGLQGLSSGGDIYVNSESVAVVGKLVDDESVLVENVNFPSNIVVCLGEIPYEGHFHLPPSSLGAETEGHNTNCLQTGGHEREDIAGLNTDQNMFVHCDVGGGGGGVAVTALRPDNVSISNTGAAKQSVGLTAPVGPFYTGQHRGRL